MPPGPENEFGISAPTVQKETLWIGVFRKQVMKKKGLQLGLEGWAGREKSCAFPRKGLANFIAVIHPGKQQPRIEIKYLM